MDQIKLGDKVRHTLTGLEGIAVVKVSWLNGCDCIGIQPIRLKNNKKVELDWADVQNVTLLEANYVERMEREATAPESLTPLEGAHSIPIRRRNP